MKIRDVTHQLRSNVPGTKVILLIGPDGVMLDHLAIDEQFDLERFFSEYAMLLRIAQSTSEDTGAGNLQEHICVSQHSVAYARCFASVYYLVLVSNIEDPIGRARYELKRAASYLERTMR